MDNLHNTHVFNTKRLKVKKLVPADFEAFHEMQSDDKVMQFTTMRGLNRSENEQGMQKVIDAYGNPKNDFWVWAVHNDTFGFVGTCALIVNEHQEWEIGYRFLRKYWGMGFGKEITAGLIDFSRNLELFSELFAYVDNRNIASIKILDKTGFERIETIVPEHGDYLDYKYKISFHEK